MTREEQLACLKDRPCDVCKMRTEHGCSSWECVFEQAPDDENSNREQEPCGGCINTEPKKIDEWDICGKSAELWIVDSKIQIRHRGTIHNVALPSIQPKPDILDKIRADVINIADDRRSIPVRSVIKIIDKHLAENEHKAEIVKPYLEKLSKEIGDAYEEYDGYDPIALGRFEERVQDLIDNLLKGESE